MHPIIEQLLRDNADPCNTRHGVLTDTEVAAIDAAARLADAAETLVTETEIEIARGERIRKTWFPAVLAAADKYQGSMPQ